MNQIHPQNKFQLNTLDVEPTDYIICCAFPFLLPDKVLELAQILAINVHPSILPMWRGPDPLRNALVKNDPFLGVSLHAMTSCFDKGQILAQYIIANDMKTTLSAYLYDFAVNSATMLNNLIANKFTLETVAESDYLCSRQTPYAYSINSQIVDLKSSSPQTYWRLTN